MTWEEEFDKEFPTVEVNSLAEFASAAEILQTYPSRIKSFIRTQKSQSVQEERERIIKEYGYMGDGCGCCSSTDLKTELSLTPSKE